MHARTIINCAITGAGDTVRTNPHVPVTPQQIAEESVAAARAGASVVHLHVRDPATGRASMETALYRETVERIRDSGVDVIINLTTGPGARFFPGPDNPRHAGPGSTLTTPEERVQHVLELMPEICSLDVATFNMGANAMVNVHAHLVRMAALVQAAGVLPELEVFDLGHIRLARHMQEEGQLTGPALFQLCLGVPWGAAADAETMLAMRNALPPGSIWAAFGIGRTQFPSVALAAAMGGHVRVGLEDNLYLGHRELAPGNASLVARAATIIEAMGGSVASTAEARQQLHLAPPQDTAAASAAP
ncbi:MAG: 3-keto-5-aminohexanoate cleavage protein [Casimicrobiaceae bacterium]